MQVLGAAPEKAGGHEGAEEGMEASSSSGKGLEIEKEKGVEKLEEKEGLEVKEEAGLDIEELSGGQGEESGAEGGRSVPILSLGNVTPCPWQDKEMEDSKLTMKEEEGNAAQRICHMHERTIPIHHTVEALDVREEGEEGEPALCHGGLVGTRSW